MSGLKFCFLVSMLWNVFVCNTQAKVLASDLSDIQLPAGFSITYFADNVPNARSMTLGDKGFLFVGTRTAGRVYALLDVDQDGRVDQQRILFDDLNMPNGVAYYKGDLFIAEVHRVIKIRDIEDKLINQEKIDYEVVDDRYPDDRWHGWKYIAFGPDGWLYVPVGAPCNVCDRGDEGYSKLWRWNPQTGDRQIVAQGIRNTVGFDWDPQTEKLWFTDNGRDMLGDDLPADELNRVEQLAEHFGFPYCHAGDLADPEFGHLRKCQEFRAPELKLGAHVAALGMAFNRYQNFPEVYHDQIFIAEHGSWNRSTKIGYRVGLVTLDQKRNVQNYQVFAQGWLKNEKVSGRPVDILFLSDGSMLVSDDYRGAIYRITYQKTQ